MLIDCVNQVEKCDQDNPLANNFLVSTIPVCIRLIPVSIRLIPVSIRLIPVVCSLFRNKLSDSLLASLSYSHGDANLADNTWLCVFA